MQYHAAAFQLLFSGTMNKPVAPACERNRQPILQELKPVLADVDYVLEVGSGTGQHAVYFAGNLPHLQWQPSDRAENLPGIALWREDSALENLLPAVELDVAKPWPVTQTPAVFSANTLHIMGWPSVKAFFDGIGRHLLSGGSLVVYGPFNYEGRYTSDSNAAFDQWLKERDQASGIRDFEAVNTLAEMAGLKLVKDIAMPANNRLLVWCKH